MRHHNNKSSLKSLVPKDGHPFDIEPDGIRMDDKSKLSVHTRYKASACGPILIFSLIIIIPLKWCNERNDAFLSLGIKSNIDGYRYRCRQRESFAY